MDESKPDLTRVGECLWRHQSGKYYAIVRVGGKQIKRSLKTDDLAFAKRKLREFRKKVERVGTGGKTMRFSELADLWLASVKPKQAPHTYRTSAGIVRQLNLQFGTQEARDITRRDVDEWRGRRSGGISRYARPLSPRRFNYELETLRQIFRYGINVVRCLLDDPTEGQTRLRLTTKERLAPTHEEFGRLVQALRAEPNSSYPGGAADAVELLAYAGFRLGSIPRLKWEHVDFAKGNVRAFNTKKNRWFTLPMFPSLRDFLVRLREKYHKARPSDRLIQIDDAKKALKGACQRAELPHFTHHSLRHFFATNAVEAGIDFKVIAGWLDHTDGGVLLAKTYGHLRQDHSDAMAQRMTFSAATPSPLSSEASFL